MLGLPIHDNWWQTDRRDHGGQHPAFAIKPGSMGRPAGWTSSSSTTTVTRVVSVIDKPDVEGELALRVGWPSMFRGYLNQDERYRKCFHAGSGATHLSGDLVKRDADGLPVVRRPRRRRHQGSGHLIGPFEVRTSSPTTLRSLKPR